MVGDKLKKMVIVTSVPFPNGFAPSARIISYCKGFADNEYTSEVVVIKPNQEKNNKGYKSYDIYDGINFIYPGKIVTGNKNIIIRQFQYRYSIIVSLFYVIKNYIINKKATFVIYYGVDPYVELTLLLFSKMFKLKIYKEESENPQLYFDKYRFLPKWYMKFIYMRIVYKKYTGILVMTQILKKLFITNGIPENKILIVSQTVDIKRFENCNLNFSITLPSDYIAYVGSLKQKKDGVLTLVKAFYDVSINFPKIHLVIAGEASHNEIEDLMEIINRLKLEGKVHYIGSIKAIEIPTFFYFAKLLVSCRPYSLQSEYGFPTKVVEYLASGKPLVTTLTGELTTYLQDNVNAFIANDENHENISTKIIEVLNNYDFAIKVALKGKEIVSNKFNPGNQALLVINFFNN